MNQLPNLITSVRFFAAAFILWSCFNTADHGANSFLPLFIAAGISDMLDGHVARTYKWCTEFGAKFDSISDLFLYIAVATFLWFNAPEQLDRVRILVLLGFSIQLFHLVLASIKHKQFPAYHTTFSRVCAYLIFFGINSFWISKSSAIFPLLVVSCIIFSLEGIVITSILKRPLTNLRGIKAAIFANKKMQS